LTMDTVYIIATASLYAIACGTLGSFLMLRKMAMLGDAISHAVLPGIVIAFLISGSRDSLTMLAGASALGILTSFIIEFFHKKARLQTDASIGVSFTSLFALGVILISVFAGQVDLDQECVLYGEIAYVPLDLWILKSGTVMGPRALYIALIIALIVIAFTKLGFPFLKITSFDTEYALSLGISVGLWHYILMAMVSLTTVAAFDSVGAILVVALFIVAPATAYLLSNKLSRMIWINAILSILISILSYYLALWINGSIAGAWVSCAGLFFFIALLFAPDEGLLSKRKKINYDKKIHFEVNKSIE
jgi:manganese/zinc/iron transport system permease protein